MADANYVFPNGRTTFSNYEAIFSIDGWQFTRVVREYLAHIVTYASPPDTQVEQRFWAASASARFLFRDAVDERIDEVWKRANEFPALHRRMQHTFKTEERYGERNREREGEQLKWFFAHHEAAGNVW